MRILQVFPILSPTHGGGVFAVGYALSKALVERGHDVAIYTTDFKLDPEVIRSLPGADVRSFHIWLNLAGFSVAPGIVAEARERLRDFDIIHLHSYRDFLAVALCRYARKKGVPYIIDAHGSVPRHGRKLNWLYDVVFGDGILKGATRCIAETSLGVREYEERKVDPRRIVLLYPPFPVEDYQKVPPSGHFRERFGVKERHIILYLGRISWIKGLDFLIETFSDLAKSRNDVRLVIVGPDEGYQPVLQKLADELNVSDKVLFTGYLGGVEKQEVLVDASVLVQPSRYEQGLSWVSIEAILCDTPIIVSKDTGAAEDVLRMDAGYLVEYGNRAELMDRIRQILDDPAEADAKTQRAKKYITSNLSLKKKVEEYEEIYEYCSRIE